ncbi:TPA: hypothetical protein QCQ26_005179 [Bacillus cereus]|nr:hypothetical protein [Bacillus cereus]
MKENIVGLDSAGRDVTIQPGYNEVVNVPEFPLSDGRFLVSNYTFKFTDQNNPMGDIRVVEAYPDPDCTQWKIRFYSGEVQNISIKVAPVYGRR